MADKKISELPNAASLDGTELVELVQGGSNVKGTTATVAQFAQRGVAVVTEGGTSRTAQPADAGAYVRFTAPGVKTYTFDGALSYTVGSEFHARNAASSGDLTLSGINGFTLHAPAGGSLVVAPGGTVTVKVISATAADVIGLTKPTP